MQCAASAVSPKKKRMRASVSYNAATRAFASRRFAYLIFFCFVCFDEFRRIFTLRIRRRGNRLPRFGGILRLFTVCLRLRPVIRQRDSQPLARPGQHLDARRAS